MGLGARRRRGLAPAHRVDHVLDAHFALRAIERHADVWCILGLCVRDHIGGRFHVEERRHLRGAHQPHRVLVQQAEAADGAHSAEGAATKRLDVVAFHERGIRVEEEAPMGLIAAEQRARALAVGVAETEERQPPVAAFLTEQADCRVLSEEPLRRAVRVLGEGVHHHEAAQAAGAAEVARLVEDVRADAPHLVGHGRLEGEGVAGHHARVGPGDQLVVVVRMRLIELARDGGQIDRGVLREALAQGGGRRGAAGRATEVGGGELARRPRR